MCGSLSAGDVKHIFLLSYLWVNGYHFAFFVFDNDRANWCFLPPRPFCPVHILPSKLVFSDTRFVSDGKGAPGGAVESGLSPFLFFVLWLLMHMFPSVAYFRHDVEPHRETWSWSSHYKTRPKGKHSHCVPAYHRPKVVEQSIIDQKLQNCPSLVIQAKHSAIVKESWLALSALQAQF